MMSYLWILLLGSLLIGAQSQEISEEPAGDLEAAEPEPAAEEVPAAAEETEAVEPEATPEEEPAEAEETEPAGPEDTPEAEPAEAEEAEETEVVEPEATPEAETPEAAPEEEPAGPEETEVVEPEAGEPEAAEPDAAAAPEDGKTEGDSVETVGEEEIVPAEGEKTEGEAAPEEPAAVPADPETEAGDGDLNLADALGAEEEDVKPGRSRSGGSVAHTGEAASDGSAEAQEASSGSAVAGILSAVGVALVGAISGYVAYQKKKLCFKNRGADPESARKQEAEAQSDPQVLSNLLSSS
ncbi:protein TsetseEP isoform X2 [Hypomesus transpacificus]|uniref:protein TsetseEP isoform X2 n=1 Tax=Hypomesus transpacificus TaxID=137520 RepID=UPI001F07CFEC|nr:protein TsetseEP isoform X2 [Hypomesus transpacificus]